MTVMVGGRNQFDMWPATVQRNVIRRDDESVHNSTASTPLTDNKILSTTRELHVSGGLKTSSGGVLEDDVPALRSFRNTRVIMAEDTPARTASVPVPPHSLHVNFTQDKFSATSSSQEDTLPLKASGAELMMDGQSLSSWLPLLAFAEDVQAESVRLTYACDPSKLQVIVTRDVAQGVVPRLWFSSDIAAQLGLPFLNFSHIRGKEYICPLCRNTFRAPNPLKLHLATSCGTIPSTMLWSRLLSSPSPALALTPWSLPFLFTNHSTGSRTPLGIERRNIISLADKVINASASASSRANTYHEASLSRESVSVASLLINNLNRSQSLSTHHENESYRSAFQPVISHDSNRKVTAAISTVPQITSSAQFLPSRYINQSPVPQADLVARTAAMNTFIHLTDSSRNNATTSTTGKDTCAEVEALVSNLGRGRGGGHVCLYCGKVYSRKYGLKIHIRTHTGYKPLSCRVCHRAFGDPSNLNKHVRLHAEGATPYRCKYCGKVLVRQRDLARHLASRHPDKANISNNSLTADDDVNTDDEADVEIEKLDTVDEMS